MKHYIKTVTWQLSDSSEIYPELRDKKIKVTSPHDIVDNFRFCLMGKSENGL